MSAVDSSFVLLPRFTTLVGAPAGSGPAVFATLPMDVSAYGGAQFQVWRGAFRTKSGTPAATFKVYLEESLDTETWVLGPGTSAPVEITTTDAKFFSYSFRLRWFRLRVALDGDEPIVTCWAEGLLRGGGSGVWPAPATGSAAGSVDLAGSGRFAVATRRGTPWQEQSDRISESILMAQQLGIGSWNPATQSVQVLPK